MKKKIQKFMISVIQKVVQKICTIYLKRVVRGHIH